MEMLKELYNERFGRETGFRNRMWKVLCEGFFQRYVPKEGCVMDIAAGYCEFINNIKCARKIAVDRNPDSKLYALPDVEVITTDAFEIKTVADSTADAIFISDFLEHITKDRILQVLSEASRILKPGGVLLILQPNIRYCWRDYWMFFDHITPLDDRSTCEALIVSGFDIEECRPKFLPYTTKSRLRHGAFLLKAYLRLRPAQFIFGKQAFIAARKKA